MSRIKEETGGLRVELSQNRENKCNHNGLQSLTGRAVAGGNLNNGLTELCPVVCPLTLADR